MKLGQWRIDSEQYEGGVCYSVTDESTGSAIAFYSDLSIEDRFMCHFLKSLADHRGQSVVNPESSEAESAT